MNFIRKRDYKEENSNRNAHKRQFNRWSNDKHQMSRKIIQLAEVGSLKLTIFYCNGPLLMNNCPTANKIVNLKTDHKNHKKMKESLEGELALIKELQAARAVEDQAAADEQAMLDKVYQDIKDLKTESNKIITKLNSELTQRTGFTLLIFYSDWLFV